MNGQEIVLRGLSARGDAGADLAPLDLDVAAGEHLALVDDGEAGGRTFLDVLAGYLRPQIGRVVVGGRDVTDLPVGARSAVLVPTGLGLFASDTVAENVAFGLHAAARDAATRRRRLDEILARFDLGAVADRRTTDLDGETALGVALARALVVARPVLLLDRVFVGLDDEARRRVRARLDGLRRDHAPTLVERTDRPTEALALADRIAVFAAGRLVQVDTPHRIWSAPASLAVALRFGEADVLPGRVVACDAAAAIVDTPVGRLIGTRLGEIAAGDAVTVALRPERTEFDAPGLDPDHPRITADWIGRRLEGPTSCSEFTAAGHRLRVRRVERGLADLPFPGRSTLVVRPGDPLVHPASDATDRR